MTRDTWYDRLPKVELHLHLEGAIPHPTLWELVQKYGGDASVPTIESLERRFKYSDFAHFLETWRWKNLFLREYADFALIGEAVAHDLVLQNIRYAEVFFSPADFKRHGLQTQKIAQAIRAGLSRVPAIEIALIADFGRDNGPETSLRVLAEVNEVRDLGVVGVGIGGPEKEFPPELFEPVFVKARQLGFHTSAHAGEAAGAASVWGALKCLQVERIGHGTRAEEDPALIDYLVEHRIPLEMCPISNLRTGVIPSIGEHPARRFFERGIVVTINSDDPKMFGNCLADEYRLIEENLGFSRVEICQLISNAIQSAWLPEKRKHALAESFHQDPAWLV